MLAFASTMITKESGSLGLPDFPVTNLKDVAQILVCTVFFDFILKRYMTFSKTVVLLTLSQATDIRLPQTERVCRRQFQIKWK